MGRELLEGLSGGCDAAADEDRVVVNRAKSNGIGNIEEGNGFEGGSNLLFSEITPLVGLVEESEDGAADEVEEGLDFIIHEMNEFKGG